MTKKMTISENFSAIIELAENGKPLTAEHIAFLKERKAVTDKKSENRSMTATQKENEKFKECILAVMSANPNKSYTIGDLIKNVPEIAELTNQRVSAIVRQLKDSLLVDRSEAKGRAYFQIAK